MKKCLTPDELEAKAIDYTKTLADAGITSFPDQIKYFMDKGDRAKHQLALLAPYLKDAYKRLGFGNDEAIDNFNIAKHVQTLDAIAKKEAEVKPDGQYQQPVSKETAKFIGGMIEKAFPGITQNFLSGEEFKAKHGTEARGAVHEGGIDLNLDHLTASTQVHEAGHIWMSWAKRYAPELYQEGMKLAANDSVGIQQALDRGYGHLSQEQLHEEVMAHAIGEQGARRMEVGPQALAERSLATRIFDKVKAFVERTLGIKLDPDFQNQTVADFAAQIASKLMSGDKISDITTEEIKAFEKDTGITRFDLQQPRTDFFSDEENARVHSGETMKGKGVSDATQPHISKSEGAKTDNLRIGDVNTVSQSDITRMPRVMSGTHERKMVGDAHAAIVKGVSEGLPASAALKSYFYKMLDKIAETKDTRLGAESPIRKNFTQDLYTALKDIGAEKFNKDFEIMAQQIGVSNPDVLQSLKENFEAAHTKEREAYRALESDPSDKNKKAYDKASEGVKEASTRYAEVKDGGKFNIKDPAYSDGFRKMYDNLLKHADQAEHNENTQGAVIVNDDYKIGPEELAKIGKNKDIGPYREKLNKFLGNNPSVRKLTGFLNDHFLQNVNNIALWTKGLSGSENSLLYKLGEAIGVHAVGNKAVYRNNFNAGNGVHILDAPWYNKGSHTAHPELDIYQLETENAKVSPFEGETIEVPLTTEEWFDFFMQAQRDAKTRAAWFGSEEKPKTIGIELAEIKGRDAKEVQLGYEHYEQAMKMFDPHHDAIVEGWVKPSQELGVAVNREFKKENGVALIPINSDRAEGEKWGYYYPHSLAKETNEVHEVLRLNKFVNDIASHKTYSPTGDESYTVKSASKKMQNYRDGNSNYAAYAIAIQNMDNYLAANNQLFKDLGITKDAQWFKQYKADLFNPEKSASGFWGSKIIAPYMLSKLGMNIFVSGKQFTAIPLALNSIPAKYLLRARNTLFSTIGNEVRNYDMFTDWMGRDKKVNATIEEMNMRSGYALYRNTNGNSEMQRFVQDSNISDYGFRAINKIVGKDLKINKNDLMKNIQTPDKAIGAMYWNAAKMMVNEEHQLFPKDGQKFWNKVEDAYIHAITESQHSSDDANRSQLARSHTFLAKSLTLFGSQQIAAFSGLHSRVIDWINNPTPETRKALGIQAANVVVTNAALVATIETARFMLLGSASSTKKPEDVYAEKFFAGLTSNIPIAAPVINQVESKWHAGMYGQDMTYVVYEVVNGIENTVVDGLHAGLDKGTSAHQKTIDHKFLLDLGYSLGNLTGIPATAVAGANKMLGK